MKQRPKKKTFECCPPQFTPGMGSGSRNVLFKGLTHQSDDLQGVDTSIS